MICEYPSCEGLKEHDCQFTLNISSMKNNNSLTWAKWCQQSSVQKVVDLAHLLSSRWRTTSCHLWLLNDSVIVLSSSVLFWANTHFPKMDLLQEKQDSLWSQNWWLATYDWTVCEQHTKQNILENNFELVHYISIDFFFFCPFRLPWHKRVNNCMKHKLEATVCVTALLNSGLLMFNACLISRQQ